MTMSKQLNKNIIDKINSSDVDPIIKDFIKSLLVKELDEKFRYKQYYDDKIVRSVKKYKKVSE